MCLDFFVWPEALKNTSFQMQEIIPDTLMEIFFQEGRKIQRRQWTFALYL